MQTNFLSKNILINDKTTQGSLNNLSSYKSLKIYSKNDIDSVKGFANQPKKQIQQIIDTKHIKNDQFIFRMKLKLISCMQQFEIQKQQIENLRKLQNDTQILQCFSTQIKKQFNILKKYKQQSLLRKQSNHSPRNNSKKIQALQKISLQSQLSQYIQSQKRLKLKSQKLFTQNAQLLQKIKQKQHLIQQKSNQLYQIRLQIKQSQSVIQNLKSSCKKAQKQFIKQKQRLQQQINNLKQYITKQRQLKHNFSSKLQIKEIQDNQKQTQIKRFKQQIQFLKKQNIKWKNRAEWKQKQLTEDSKEIKKKYIMLEAEIQKLKESLKKKQTQLQLTVKQQQNGREFYNKRLQKIVQQWKDKLIQNVQQYQTTLGKCSLKLSQKQNRIQTLVKQNQILNDQISLKKLQIQTINKEKHELNERIQKFSNQAYKKPEFYERKIKQQMEIIQHQKEENNQLKKQIENYKKDLYKYQIVLKQQRNKFIQILKQLSSKQEQISRLKTENQQALSIQQKIIQDLQKQKTQVLLDFEHLRQKCQKLDEEVQKNLIERQSVKKFLELKKQNQTQVPRNVLFKKQSLISNSKQFVKEKTSSQTGSDFSKLSSLRSMRQKTPIYQFQQP